MEHIGFDAPYFADNNEARIYLESIRWPNGVVCPHCGSNDEHYSLKAKEDSERPIRQGVWKCKKCRKQFSVTVGTVFERSHIPLNKWLLAAFLLCSSKKGMSAHQLHRMLNVTYQQQGEVDGEVIRIGGSKEVVPITLEVEGREISGFHAKRIIAKELAKNIFEPVRLYGEGRWNRNADGEWNLNHFMVDRFDVLQESTLSKTVIALRSLKGEWSKDSLNELLESRHYKDKH